MDAAAPLLVVCLCAQWCGACRDYRSVFDAAAVSSGFSSRFVWIDIEDDAALLDGIDVENFPTLLIARADAPVFFGPVMPHPQTLSRLVETAASGALLPMSPVLPVSPSAAAATDLYADLCALVERVRSG